MFKIKNFLFKLFTVLFAILIFIFFSAKSYSQIMFENISNNFLRLHIVANSDSTEDQMLKYKIRDSIIDYLEPIFKDIDSKEEAIILLNSHLDDITKLSYDVMTSLGFNYPINISIGNYYFPRKNYSQITLPEGYYDALKIDIGKADGQNWWCVMFPSLCIVDTNTCNFSSDSNTLLQENLGTEEYSIITNSEELSSLKIKFKLIELFENI